MATGKTGSFEITGTKSVTAKILWSETYDVISNTSVVTITDVQVKNSSWYGYTYYLSGSLQINGTTVVTFDSTMGTHSVRPGSLNTYTSISANGSYDPAPWGEVTVSMSADDCLMYLGNSNFQKSIGQNAVYGDGGKEVKKLLPYKLH